MSTGSLVSSMVTVGIAYYGQGDWVNALRKEKARSKPTTRRDLDKIYAMRDKEQYLVKAFDWLVGGTDDT